MNWKALIFGIIALVFAYLAVNNAIDLFGR